LLRYSFGNIDGKAYGLNANELSVYEAIGKCSRKDDARGWYASLQALADALPYIVDRKTVTRAVQKLLTLGLIERRGKALFACGQNDQLGGQNDRANDQNDQSNGQNDRELPPPFNPPINNNNEMEKENTRTCVPTHNTATSDLRTIYFEIRKIFNEKHGLHKVGEGLAAEEAWKQASHAKHVKLLEAVKSGQWDKPRIDWLIADFPEPTPTNWQGTAQGGDMLNDGTAKIALYNGRYGIYSLDDIRLFNLELSDYQRGRK
jgi:hypothetical protein